MKLLLSYLIQLGGLVAAGVAIVLIFDNKLATGLLVFGALAWWVGAYLRQKDLI